MKFSKSHATKWKITLVLKSKVPFNQTMPQCRRADTHVHSSFAFRHLCPSLRFLGFLPSSPVSLHYWAHKIHPLTPPSTFYIHIYLSAGAAAT